MGTFFQTQHQVEDAHERVSRPQCCGCFQCWADMRRFCKKLRKFDDAQLERQFVQHQYRSPLYFGFITFIAVLILCGSGLCFYWGIKPHFQYGGQFSILKYYLFPIVFHFVAGVALLVSGIGLIIAARIRRIRERHWDKVALSAAVLLFVAQGLLALAYQTITVIPYGEPSNYTYVKCPGLFDSSMVPAVPDPESLLCEQAGYSHLFAAFLLLWVGPLFLPFFGLDFRRYAPLLVTESIINVFIFLGSYYGTHYIHSEGNSLKLLEINIFYPLIFACIVGVSLLWAALSSESAARGAWIRQQNW